MLGLLVAFGVLSALMGMFLRGWEPAKDWRLTWASQEAPGRITRVRETGCEENEVSVYQYLYQFQLPDGTTRQGLSYSTGHCLAPEALPPGGHPVVVEYHPEHLEASRIQNGRASPFSIYWLFLLFPGLPVTFCVLGVRGAFRQVRLLKNGELAAGRVTGLYLRRKPNDSDSSVELIPLAEATAFPPNGTSTRCDFEFVAPGGMRTQGTGAVPFTPQLLALPEVTVLYDPDRPEGAMLLEDMEVGVTGAGEWEPTGKRASRALAALAAISLFGGLYLAWLGSQQPVRLQ